MGTFRPNLLEHPPGRKTDDEANHKGEYLPIKRNRGNQACGGEEDRSKEWAKRQEGRDEFTLAEEFRDPGERPIIPIEARGGEEKPISEQGDDGEGNRDMSFGEAD